MNILLTLSFHGGCYHGFQVQKNALSVCEVLQNAMEKLFGCRPDVKGCSRTDAGVHALTFCASFKHQTNLPDEKLPLALNYHLPSDIRVLAARRVDEEFHARYSCIGKEYHYVFWNSPVHSPFLRGLCTQVPGHINHQAMHAAGQVFVGRQNFAAFMAAGSTITDTVRTISALSVERQGDKVTMKVAADGFLYNMVRIMAGSLLAVGKGKADSQNILAALQSGRRADAGDTLPPEGLFLARVFYPPQTLPTAL